MDEQQQIESAEPGDLIEIFRLRGYEHWAVYIGNEEVVHLGTPNDEVGPFSSLDLSSGSFRALVMRHRIQEVTKRDYWTINNLLDDEYKPREKHVIVRDAISLVGKRLLYSVTEQNCEHFVTKLRYGKAESRQVRNIAIRFVKAAGAVILGAPLTVAVATGAAVFSLFSLFHSSSFESHS